MEHADQPGNECVKESEDHETLELLLRGKEPQWLPFSWVNIKFTRCEILPFGQKSHSVWFRPTRP